MGSITNGFNAAWAWLAGTAQDAGAQASIDKKNEFDLPRLYAAVMRLNLEEARRLLEAGASVDEVTRDGHTPLLRAMESDNTKMVRLLLEWGASVDEVNQNGRTPLHKAAGLSKHDKDINFRFDSIPLLLEKTHSVNKKDKWDQSPLHIAAAATSSTIGKKYKDGTTRGFFAPKEAHVEKNRQLLEAGASASIKDKDYKGKTPLHYASEYGALEVVNLYLKHGAKASINEKDNEGKTPLDYAREDGNDELVRVLIEAGASVSVDGKDNAPTSPVLDKSAPWLDISVSPWVGTKPGFPADAKCTVDTATGDFYHTDGNIRLKSLAVFATAPIYGLVNSAIQLASIPFDLFTCKSVLSNLARRIFYAVISPFVGIAVAFTAVYGLVSPNNGRKALNTVADYFHDERRYLAAFGLRRVGNLDDKVPTSKSLIGPPTQDDPLDTQLNTAVRRDMTADGIIKLISEGASVHAKDKHGRTALLNGLERGTWNLHGIRLFLDDGSSVNEADESGNTALHYAAMRHNHGRVDVVRLLLDNGAIDSINRKNNQGKTPLDCAKECDFSELVHVLQDAGKDQ